MSKRRKRGEVVRRRPGSGFLSDINPERVKIAENAEIGPCLLDCGDRRCREWSDVEAIGYDGQRLYHISECEMEDDDAPFE